MLDNLFWVILLGGMPVILSYAHVYFNYTPKLWANLEGPLFWIWLISALLTVISYMYLFVFFVFFNTQHEPVLCALYTVFLSSAAQWGAFAITDSFYGEKSTFILINLMLTGAASVGIALVAFIVGDPIAYAAAIILVLHHVIMDAIVWYRGFLNDDI